MISKEQLIQRYKKINNHKRLFKGNRKVAKGVGIFNLPAVNSCLNCGDCMATCYARQAQNQYPSVRAFRNSNYSLAKENTEVLKQLLDEQIKKENIKVIRIHESGDFFSEAYIQMWFSLAIMNPEVRFYAYTKVWDKNKFPEIAAGLSAIDELSNVNIIDSYINGNRNYGTPEYIKKLKGQYNCYTCPAKGCMSECIYCLENKNVVFEIHGTLKNKDQYKEEVKNVRSI